MEGWGYGLPEGLHKPPAAHAAVLVQIVQNLNLAFGRGPHRPGRVNAQQAKFFAGGVCAGGQHAGRAFAKGLGERLTLFRQGFTDAGQSPGHSLARFNIAQPHPCKAQPLWQHMPQNMTGV